jgi:hypothetical protein
MASHFAVLIKHLHFKVLDFAIPAFTGHTVTGFVYVCKNTAMGIYESVLGRPTEELGDCPS